MDELDLTPVSGQPEETAPPTHSDRNGYVYAAPPAPPAPEERTQPPYGYAQPLQPPYGYPQQTPNGYMAAGPVTPAKTPLSEMCLLVTLEDERAMRRTLSWLGVGLTLLLMGWILSMDVLAYFTGKLWTPLLSLFFNDLCLYGVGAPLFILCAFRVRPEPAPKEKMGLGGWLIAFLIAAFLIESTANVTNYVMDFLGQMIGFDTTDRIQDIGTGTPLWALGFFTVVAAPLGEEFLFRRCLCDRLRPYGEKTAALLSAFAFGLFHLNLYQFGYTLMLGLLLAYVYLKTGRLRYTVAIHAGINLVFGVLPEIISRFADTDWLERVIDSIGSGSFDVGMLRGIPWTTVALYGFYLLLTNALVIAGLVFFIRKIGRVRWARGSCHLAGSRVALRLVRNPFVWVYVLHTVALTVIYTVLE